MKHRFVEERHGQESYSLILESENLQDRLLLAMLKDVGSGKVDEVIFWKNDSGIIELETIFRRERDDN